MPGPGLSDPVTTATARAPGLIATAGGAVSMGPLKTPRVRRAAVRPAGPIATRAGQLASVQGRLRGW